MSESPTSDFVELVQSERVKSTSAWGIHDRHRSEARGNIGRKLRIEAVSHNYGSHQALQDVQFEVSPGEVVALLGPSGSGKTTILRIIAGLVQQAKGRIFVDGAAIDHLPPHRREMGLVFQSYALFPHLNVRQNIAYGLQARRLNKKDAGRLVDEILELIRLSDVADRFPRELSGGQQQRVATGRALVIRPKILLLDEPFGALDRSLRLDMQFEFLQLQRRFGITSLIVTHDQEEALSIADRVLVLNRGRVEQIGTPDEIYDDPKTLFVSSFVGTSNVLPGIVTSSTSALTRVRLALGPELATRRYVNAHAGESVRVAARPEHIALADTPGDCSLRGTIDAVISIGPMLIYEVVLADGSRIRASQLRQAQRRLFHRGMDVFACLWQDHCSVFADPSPESIRLRVSEQ